MFLFNALHVFSVDKFFERASASPFHIESKVKILLPGDTDVFLPNIAMACTWMYIKCTL